MCICTYMYIPHFLSSRGHNLQNEEFITNKNSKVFWKVYKILKQIFKVQIPALSSLTGLLNFLNSRDFVKFKHDKLYKSFAMSRSLMINVNVFIFPFHQYQQLKKCT